MLAAEQLLLRNLALLTFPARFHKSCILGLVRSTFVVTLFIGSKFYQTKIGHWIFPGKVLAPSVLLKKKPIHFTSTNPSLPQPQGEELY